MDTKNRLLEYLRFKGLSQGRFEKMCGLANGYVNNIKVSVTPDKLQKIALQFHDLNTGWLLTGTGCMLKGDSSSGEDDRSGVPYFDIDLISTSYERLRALNPTFLVDFNPLNFSDLWVNVVGNSMSPIINHGDVIALKKIREWQTFLPYGEIYAVLTEEFHTIRVIAQADDDHYVRLIPVNKSDFYSEQLLPKEEIRHLFAVCGTLKRFM